MQLLSDFPTLADAQAYEFTSYKQITVGQASQFFGLSGMLDLLEANSTNATPLELSVTMSTTVGALCRTILNSAKTTGFASDPTTEDGIANRGASQVLVLAGVFTQPLVDSFWEKAKVITKPYLQSTQADFAIAKGTMVYAQVTPENGWLKITTTADCEAHNPQIYATIQGVKRRVAGFSGVSVAGDYLAQVPTGYSEFDVDNFYGVVG